MKDIISFDEKQIKSTKGHKDKNIIDITNEIIVEIQRSEILKSNYISMPIAKLSTLGAGVSSLIPALRTINETSTITMDGLYKIANAGIGDVLKTAKSGNKWGAMIAANGKSKMVQLKEVDAITSTSSITMPIDPATIMIAVALYSVEQQLGNIEALGKNILNFLEIEKESSIEADVQTLSSIVNKYKFNWDNELFVSSNHKVVVEMQKSSRQNINGYKKKINDIIKSKQLIVSQSNVNSTYAELLNKLQYYRLALFVFSLASLTEIMLSKDFKEENMIFAKDEISSLSLAYRDIYTDCSVYLENLNKAALENNILKGIGSFSKSVGELIGSIPVIKDGAIDEFLQDSGNKLKDNVSDSNHKILEMFSRVSDPRTKIFLEEMDNLIQIYGHTESICFDDEQIYLVSSVQTQKK